jgi:nucleotide-binding universal stress UspA family protein
VFTRILITLDGSKLAERALPHALHIANVFRSKVFLLQVLEPGGKHDETAPIDPLSWQIQKAESELYLKSLQNETQKIYPQVEYQILEGKTSEAILRFAQSHDIDLLVMSSHGKSGLSRWNISNVVQKVVSKAYLPVLIVRAYQPAVELDEPFVYKKIMLPVDCSKRAECALPAAIAIAEANGAQVVLVNVLRRPEIPFSVTDTAELIQLADKFMFLSREAAEVYMQELRSRFPVRSSNRIVESSSVPQAIHDLADEEEADLLVFCAHGQTGPVKWPYGSVSGNYIENGSRSVLVIQDIPQNLVNPTRVEIAATETGTRG